LTYLLSSFGQNLLVMNLEILQHLFAHREMDWLLHHSPLQLHSCWFKELTILELQEDEQPESLS